ncbi:hypothetical protein EDB83DRAFT_2314856 [Lactarius deliciosus]|nr:hypothetical protein EDB83DRAFT_2314856 [Lactarius deliciosus]
MAFKVTCGKASVAALRWHSVSMTLGIIRWFKLGVRMRSRLNRAYRASKRPKQRTSNSITPSLPLPSQVLVSKLSGKAELNDDDDDASGNSKDDDLDGLVTGSRETGDETEGVDRGNVDPCLLLIHRGSRAVIMLVTGDLSEKPGVTVAVSQASQDSGQTSAFCSSCIRDHDYSAQSVWNFEFKFNIQEPFWVRHSNYYYGSFYSAGARWVWLSQLQVVQGGRTPE